MQNATYFKLSKIDLINCHLMLNKRIWVAYTLFEGFLANFLRVHSTPFFFFPTKWWLFVWALYTKLYYFAINTGVFLE